MNRFIRLARLDNLIKSAAKRSDDIAALRNILMGKYGRAAAGFAHPYYDRFIVTSDLSSPAITEGTLPQPLPATIDELRKLLSEGSVELSEAILKAHPSIDLKGFSKDHLTWIYKRYVKGESERDEVIHPIEDAIPTLRRFIYAAL